MSTIRDLADRYDLSEREMLAVARLAGVTADKGSSPVSPADAQTIDDVISGRVVPKAPKVRKPVPWRRVGIAGFACVAMGVVVLVVGTVFGGEAAVNVQAGDCFDEPPFLGAVLDPVPCSRSHKYKAFARLNLEVKFGEEYPGEDVLERHVRSRCSALHSGQGGGSTPGFTFVQVYYFYPDGSAWDRGARAAICAVLD